MEISNDTAEQLNRTIQANSNRYLPPDVMGAVGVGQSPLQTQDPILFPQPTLEQQNDGRGHHFVDMQHKAQQPGPFSYPPQPPYTWQGPDGPGPFGRASFGMNVGPTPRLEAAHGMTQLHERGNDDLAAQALVTMRSQQNPHLYSREQDAAAAMLGLHAPVAGDMHAGAFTQGFNAPESLNSMLGGQPPHDNP